MADSFSGCEIVELGVQIEKNGRDFYDKLAEQADDPDVKKAFTELGEAEEQHILAFKKIFEGSCKYEPQEAFPEEYFAYMNALASQHVFTKAGAGLEVAKSVKSYMEGIALAIQFEKDSILFYEGIKRLVPEEDRSIVEGLILEEKNHLSKLCSLKGGCTDEECKGV